MPSEQIQTLSVPLDPSPKCYFNGDIVPQGNEVLAYLNSTAAAGMPCASEKRKCDDGVLSGSYQYSICLPQGSKRSCLFNGKQIQHNETVQGFINSFVPRGAACSSKAMTCDDGVLSGAETYSYPSCEIEGGKMCQWGGLSIASGESVVGYRQSLVDFGQECVSKTLTCIDGQLPSADEYRYSVCTKEAARSCSFNGVPVAHQQTVVGFKSQSVPVGGVCDKKVLTCFNGEIADAQVYSYSGCTVKAGGDCQFEGVTVEHGQSIVGYKAAQVPFGLPCESASLTCINGTLGSGLEYRHRKCEWAKAKTLPSVDDYGAKGDGVSDDTSAFEAAALVGGAISLKANKTYKVSRRVVFSQATTLFGNPGSKIILSGAGSLAIHASYSTMENFSIDGRGMNSGVCAVTLLNDHPGWQRNIVIRNLQGEALPCFVGDDRAPAQTATTNTYVDVFISGLTSQAGRGPQIILRSAWAFLFVRDISISMATPAGGPIFSLGPNEGSLISGLQIQGSGVGAQEAGIQISNSAAVFLSDSSVKNVGGDGIVLNQVTYTYWRNLSFIENKGYGSRTYNVSNFLKSNIQFSGNSLGSELNIGTSGLAVATTVTGLRSPPSELRSTWTASLSQVDNYAWVTDFGAKGDGVTDDSDAFQAAINSGANIYLPAGVYNLSKTIYVAKPVRVQAKEGVTSVKSSAQHAFHLTSSNVVLSGFKIEMLGRSNDIAVYLNSYSQALTGIFIHEVDSFNAGFTVTNISTGQYPVSVNLHKIRAWYPRNTGFHFTKMKNSIMQHVFGEYVGMNSAVNYPFIFLSDSHNNAFNEGTVLGYGPSGAHSDQATGFILSQSSDFYLNRWQGDVNNGHGLIVEKSERVNLTDIVFTPVAAGSIPVIIDQSKSIYGANFLFTQPAGARYCMSLTGNDSVALSGFLNLGYKPIYSSGNSNMSLPPGMN